MENQNSLHEVVVTKIGDGWNIRVFYKDKVVCEYRCYARQDIGYCCRVALRECHKFYTGGDRHTAAVRKRMWDSDKYEQTPTKPVRKIL